MWDLLIAVYISKGNHQTIGKLDILCVFLGFGLDLEEKCSILKLLHVGFIQTKEVGAQRGEKDKCYVQTCSYCLKSKFQTIHCSKQMWDLLTTVYVSKENHQTIGKLDILCVFLGFGLDLPEKCAILKLLHVGFIQTKEVGAQRGEKDKCYVQTCSYCLKSKFQTIHCSKQMWDLLTAVYISKESHQTIGKLDILCVFLGFGLDLEGRCSILKLFTFWMYTKEDGAQRGE